MPLFCHIKTAHSLKHATDCSGLCAAGLAHPRYQLAPSLMIGVWSNRQKKQRWRKILLAYNWAHAFLSYWRGGDIQRGHRSDVCALCCSMSLCTCTMTCNSRSCTALPRIQESCQCTTISQGNKNSIFCFRCSLFVYSLKQYSNKPLKYN